MKLKKFAVITSALFIFSGCDFESGEVIYEKDGGDSGNDVYVYLQEKEGQKLYKNNDFEIACYDKWDVKVDEDGYLVKMLLNTEEGNVWLGVRKDTIDTESKDISSLVGKYAQELKNGIVKTANVNIGGKKGKWIKIEPIDNSGIALKSKKNGNKIAIDDSNLLTSDESESREDLIFIYDDNFAYVFLYHADTKKLYDDYEGDIDKFLGTFKFI